MYTSTVCSLSDRDLERGDARNEEDRMKRFVGIMALTVFAVVVSWHVLPASLEAG